MAKKKPKPDNKQENLNNFTASPYGEEANQNHNTKKQSQGRNTQR